MILNGFRNKVDIMTGEKFSSIANAFIGGAVYPVGKEGMGEIVILARYRVHFIIELENLV